MNSTQPFSTNWPFVSRSVLYCFHKTFLEEGERMGDATTMYSGGLVYFLLCSPFISPPDVSLIDLLYCTSLCTFRN